MSFSVITTACHRDDGTYDAEVALTRYSFVDQEPEILSSTEQRTVAYRLASRDEAVKKAEDWIENNLFPFFRRLPIAKP